jgi:hypothetical protein
MWLKYILFGSLGGLIIGYLFSQLLILGYFVAWQPLPPSPISASQFVGLVGQRVYIRSTGGNIFSCNPWSDTCWEPDALPILRNDPQSTVLTACQLLFPMRIITARPPVIQACIQGKGQYSDGYADYAFILDPDNRIWVWYHDMNARFEFTLAPFASIFGTLLGCISGSILVWRRRKNLYIQKKIGSST